MKLSQKMIAFKCDKFKKKKRDFLVSLKNTWKIYKVFFSQKFSKQNWKYKK